ncbi:hypothetical protein [Clostridium aciditolerans]|uniref:Uncharacterized protein n=1 Tax=Clostridium aciditolerans TaxID=339861 RepID=A0A934M321_9CLOT|nr:hypothetical protein [Clostridium aciditolerans]MBI6872565.1 hypothetical protein [Clostridium aciditolerans]
MYAAGIALTYILIIIIEVIPMIRNRKKNMVITYIIFMAISLILSALLSLGVKIPSPASAIEKIVFTIIKK